MDGRGDAPRVAGGSGARASAAADRLAAALVEVFGELDWQRLGRLACEGDGSEFFGPAAREAILDTGLLFAGDLACALERNGPSPSRPGRSLYVGASVAELAPILCETIVLEREVVWVNPRGPEASELTRTLALVGRRLAITLPSVTTCGLAQLEPAAHDHLWLVSVFTDPEAFPALHDHLYERSGELATGRGQLAQDELRARALLDEALRALRAPCLLTTSDEELALVRAAVERRDWRIAVPELARLSSVVGDPVRHCRVWDPAQRARD